MNDTRPFAPLYNPTVPGGAAGTCENSVVVAASTAAADSAVFPGTTDNNLTQIQINNEAIATAHVNFGVFGAVVPATAASYPVAGLSVVVVTVHPEVNAASVILDSGTGNVVFSRGAGT